MKIILTEEQIVKLAQIEEIYSFICNPLNEGINLNILKKKIKKLLKSGVSIGLIYLALSAYNIYDEKKKEIIEQARIEAEAELERQNKNNLIAQKVESVKDYMAMALKNQGYDFSSTNLSPEALVMTADKYNFDLPLLMAAAHLESCFGATPRAKRTNSVYSVGSFDNGKDLVTYGHPDESVEGYIKLLNSDYLINGKTINDLLKPGCFINKNGHRYAKKTNYENTLSSIRNKIIRNYPDLV